MDMDLWSIRDRIYPVLWHSDGGECYNGQSYSVYHWSTPFTYNSNPYDCKLYQLMLPEDAIIDGVADVEIAEFQVIRAAFCKILGSSPIYQNPTKS